MRDESRRQYFVIHHFRKLPNVWQALLFILLFVIIFFAAWLTQQMGLWPESWSANFDGVGE